MISWKATNPDWSITHAVSSAGLSANTHAGQLEGARQKFRTSVAIDGAAAARPRKAARKRAAPPRLPELIERRATLAGGPRNAANLIKLVSNRATCATLSYFCTRRSMDNHCGNSYVQMVNSCVERNSLLARSWSCSTSFTPLSLVLLPLFDRGRRGGRGLCGRCRRRNRCGPIAPQKRQPEHQPNSSPTPSASPGPSTTQVQ